MLRGRYGIGWMVVTWLALAALVALAVWAGPWLADATA
jgi:hypothetical protein